MFDLAKRMKNNYEDRQRFYLIRRMPVIIRVAGRAFHNFTSRCEKPFDGDFIFTMKEAAEFTANEIQCCKMAFVQSDEVSFLLTDYDNLQTESWFDSNIAKICSISASIMTAAFNSWYWGDHKPDMDECGIFDSRAFNIPREEVSNYFLWRAKDWQRNSVLMYAQSFFSHTQMQNKKQADLHEMLHNIGKNWTTDLPDYIRNGWWYVNKKWRADILPNFISINEIVEQFVIDKK